MAKKQGGGRRYRAAAALAKEARDGAQDGGKPKAVLSGPAPPKHLQRKVARKVGFLDKVANSKALAVQAGVSKKTSRKSKALQTMNTLSGVLDEVTADVQRALAHGSAQKSTAGSSSGEGGPAAFGQAVKSARARSAVQAAEAPRLQQVMQHPVFKQNPIAAITNHLKNTLPSDAAVPDSRAAKGQHQSRTEIKRLARQRKRERKEQGDLMADD